MYCRSCGTKLETDHMICPNCGVSIEQVDNESSQEDINTDDSYVDDFMFKESIDEKVDNLNEKNDNISEKPRNIKKIIIIISICIFLLLVLCIIFFLIFNKDKKDEKIVKENDGILYNGYKFKVPNNFKRSLSKDYGLFIYNKSLNYIIEIDYTNNYNSYVDYFKNIYSNSSNNLEVTLYGRKYAGIVIEKEGKKASEFITKLDEDTSFIGVVVRKDYETPIREDYEILTKILDSVKKDSTYKGKIKNNSIKTFTFDENMYKFAE